MVSTLGPSGAPPDLPRKSRSGFFIWYTFLWTLVIARMFTDMRHLVWYFAFDRVFVAAAAAAKSEHAIYRALRVFGWKYYLFHKIDKIWMRLGLVATDGQKRLPTGRTCRTSTGGMTTVS